MLSLRLLKCCFEDLNIITAENCKNAQSASWVESRCNKHTHTDMSCHSSSFTLIAAETELGVDQIPKQGKGVLEFHTFGTRLSQLGSGTEHQYFLRADRNVSVKSPKFLRS